MIHCRNKLHKVHLGSIIWMLTMAVFIVLTMISVKYIVGVIFCLLLLAAYGLRPGSVLYNITIENMTGVQYGCTIAVLLFTILVCTIPMKVFPLWNGEIPEHRNQYELMAENILEGRLHFDYGDEEELENLSNPYDPVERAESGVKHHWDHAYYNGRYYMYFGVVPVFLVFLPYRIVTGMPLASYHATQLFVAFIITGLFATFLLLCRLFFRKMPLVVYLVLSVALSVMSVSYSIVEPALYCTAITAGIALEVWSLFFFIRAVWCEKNENKQIWNAAIGALLGALVFGCRPPIALVNVVVIPVLMVFLKQHKLTMKLAGKLMLAALPYVMVAAALMLYNYARFDDPFEFGQKYQITEADQTQYGFKMSMDELSRVFLNVKDSLFGITMPIKNFPYLRWSGLFINFPVLFFMFGCFGKKNRESLKAMHLQYVVATMALLIVIITTIDVLWTPFWLERYHMDVYFLAGLVCFISIGLWYRVLNDKQKRGLNVIICCLGFVTLVSCVFFFFIQICSNPQWIFKVIVRRLSFGILGGTD